jgi:hypothetical protein
VEAFMQQLHHIMWIIWRHAQDSNLYINWIMKKTEDLSEQDSMYVFTEGNIRYV